MKHINPKKYGEELKADKERILNELSLIKSIIILNNPGTQKLIDTNGEDWVIKQFGHLPIDNKVDTYEALTNNDIRINLNEDFVTIKTINGKFGFKLDQLAMIDKMVRRSFPSSSATPPIYNQSPVQTPKQTGQLNLFDKDGCYKTKEQVLADADTRIEAMQTNVSQAKKNSNLNLIVLFQKQIELLEKAREDAENTSYENLEIERYVNQELTENDLMIKARENKNHTADWVRQFGKRLIEFNLLNYPLAPEKYTDDLNDVLELVIELKRKPSELSLAEMVKEEKGRYFMLEDEQKAKFFSTQKNCWKKLQGKSQEREFFGRKRNIEDLAKRIRLIESNLTLIELALKNEPYQVRKIEATPKVIIPSKMVDAPLLAAIIRDAVVMTTNQVKEENQIMQPQKTKRVLAIDIETYSPVDLKSSGLYPYSEHPEFEILLFAYAFDKDPVTVIDFTSLEDLPDEVFEALTDPNVLKTAHNANFERICIGRYLRIELPIDQWECTMVKSAMLGLPFQLSAVGKVLKLDQEKMTEGKALIRYFSIPCKPTKANGLRTRNMPEHDVEKWATYKKYNGRDVEAEREIREKTAFFKMHDGEKELYILDQVINDRGVMIDTQFVNNAIAMDATYKDRLTVEMTELTSLDNPNSVAQLKAWIAEETGEDVTSLTKEAILAMLKNTPSDEVTKVLKNRQEMAKTSVKKYSTMLDMVGSDGRIRGLSQFYGANRTGRWAGRGVQMQNLPQNHLYDLDLARQLVSENDLEMLEMLFGNVPDTLSQLIRTAFVAKPGCTFLVADFSAIEARVIAWVADEKWRLEVFATHGKIYEASGSQMFKVPIEEVTKGSLLRQKAKISELALGYGGGVGALAKMGAEKMGLQEDELQGLVDAWRAANPHIVKLWKTVETAAKKAVDEGTVTTIQHGIRFEGRGNVLYIELPSGRKLSYWQPTIGENKFGSGSIHYWGMNQTTKQWCDQETYGGKLVENIIQAIARDCLAYSMLSLSKAGYEIVFHVHDECIIEKEEDKADIKEVCEIMGQSIPWAKGLPLRADGYETKYYKKD